MLSIGDLAQLRQVDKKIRFPESSAFGIKPISRQGSERLMESALDFALLHKRR